MNCVTPKASSSAPETDKRTLQNKRNIEHVQIILTLVSLRYIAISFHANLCDLITRAWSLLCFNLHLSVSLANFQVFRMNIIA